MMKYLKLVQSSTSKISKSKVFEFHDTVCLYAEEVFDANGVSLMITDITISSPLIVVDGLTIMEKSWKVTDLNGNPEETVLEEEEVVKEIVECYLTDLNNKKINQINAGEKNILNLRTKNMINDKISINLKNLKLLVSLKTV